MNEPVSAAHDDPSASHALNSASELFLHHPVPLWVYHRSTLRFLAVNDAAVAQYGYARDQFLQMTVLDILADVDDTMLNGLRSNQGRRRAWRHGGIVRHRRADGTIIHAELTSHDLTFEDHPAVAMAAYDVTERVTAEAAAREAEQQLIEAQQLAQLGSWRWDIATDAVTWSDELFRIADLPPENGAPCFANQRGLYADTDWPRLKAAVDHTLRTGDPYELRVDIIRPDGTSRRIISRGAALRDTTGRITALHGTAHDITDRCEQEDLLRAAYDRLQESETRYRELVESLDDVVFSVDASGVILYTSPAVENFGYTSEELVGKPFLSLLHPDDVVSSAEAFGETLGGSRQKREFRVIDKAGRIRYVRSSNRVQLRNGVPATVSGILIDLTEQVRTQEQLRTAGRLEAVGRLAGGVAHDFNNLLVAINGFAELALADAPEGSRMHADLSEIIKAGNRAAALTGQLLAFSRSQVLRPDTISLNEVVTGMEPMLRRLIGEDIQLVIARDPDIPHVRIDTGHLEQVIMNLVVNARDAMPDGGTLCIETSRNTFPAEDLPDGLSASEIAVVSVTDTGHGMDETTQAQIFEPFFTTKPLGQGTGLGLAMVYGFVKQSGGAISVRSAPGQGATFRIALPRDQEQPLESTGHSRQVETGSETILVTEDEETVRTLVRRLLTGAGYQVITAESPEAALRICRGYQGRIHLLLTDVVMPQMSGTTLAVHARQIRPDMHVLFMSGYSGTEMAAHGLSEQDAALLQKPFSAAALSEAVRAAMSAHAN